MMVSHLGLIIIIVLLRFMRKEAPNYNPLEPWRLIPGAVAANHRAVETWMVTMGGHPGDVEAYPSAVEEANSTAKQ
jgi:hypothetical protein